MTPLELALSTRNACMLDLLLKGGARVDVRMKYCHSPMFHACANGYLTCVKLLAAFCGDINAHSPDGYTCLLVAAENGHLEVVSYLLGLESCDVNRVTSDGYSVLHYITLLDNSSILSSLVDKGADINPQTRVSVQMIPVFLMYRTEWRNGCIPCNEAQVFDFIEGVTGSWSRSKHRNNGKLVSL